MNDLNQTLDVYVDNLLRYAFKCAASSARSGEPIEKPEFSPLPMGPLSPETGGTTASDGAESTDEQCEVES